MRQGLARFVILLVMMWGGLGLRMPYVVLHVLVRASGEKHLNYQHVTILSTESQGREAI